MDENNEEKQENAESEEDIEITTPTQEEIDYIKEMITETGKVNIKYLMDMTDYSFVTVALSRALLEKDGFLEEPEIEEAKEMYGLIRTNVLKRGDISTRSKSLFEEI